ncbi:MAG: YutD family protein [Bacilli bacterium]|nr:YutD family protein [Bacilli bacterium]
MKIQLNNQEYELIKNYKDAFNEEEFLLKCTDYFYNYDYIVGDIAYGKLRLKGFYDQDNKKVNKINNYKNLNIYLEKYCAPDCKYFVVKKCK